MPDSKRRVAPDAFFAGFDSFDLAVDGVAIHGRIGGKGPPVLLLHGYPQTHVMWHHIAPALTGEHTVIVTDLRGYGDSGKPAAGERSAEYSKRAMAADQVAVMSQLGFDRFAVVGHDRGARVTHRLCLDRPDVVQRAAVIDIVPTSHVFEHVDRSLAQTYWHWFFLAQPADLPERLVGADPEAFVRRAFAAWSGDPAAFDDAALAEYVRCFSAPDAIAASCDDYRAGAGIDLDHAAADTTTIGCPLLVLWGADGFVGTRYDVLDVWREFADDARGTALPGGHFVPEEQPAATIDTLTTFLIGTA